MPSALSGALPCMPPESADHIVATVVTLVYTNIRICQQKHVLWVCVVPALSFPRPASLCRANDCEGCTASFHTLLTKNSKLA